MNHMAQTSNTSAFSDATIIAPLKRSSRLTLRPINARRRVSPKSALTSSVPDFRLASPLLAGDTVLAIGMRVAVAESRLSGSVRSLHKAGARLLSAIVRGGNSIAAVTARTVDALHRSFQSAVAVARPAPILRAVRRAAAASASAATLMLAGAPAGAFTMPLNSTSDTARIAAPLSAMGVTQAPIVINYAPNVAIHSEDAADGTALKRRVMEVLERHGRELYQVLAREIVRQQRRDFVNSAFDE
jgi:hypothetical protein